MKTRITVDVDAFLQEQDAILNAFASEHILFWCPAPTLRVLVFSDRPTEHEVQLLTRAMLIELRSDAPRHASLVDLRGVTSVDESAFEVLESFMRTHRRVFGQKITRSALVHRGGLAGAAAAGYGKVLKNMFPSRLFTEIEGAMKWLDAGVSVRKVRTGIETLRVEAQRTTELLALRSLLRERRGAVTLTTARRELGLSARDLQRKLLRNGTSFRAEVRRARIDRAQHLLRATDDKILAIALDLGYSKAQAFTAAFRRAVGTTPAAYRRGRRKRS